MFITVLLWLFISQFLAAMEDHVVKRAAHKENIVPIKGCYFACWFLVQSLFTSKTKWEKTHPPLALFTSILQAQGCQIKARFHFE